MSKKPLSIVDFRFDPVRSGKILSKWIADSGKTRDEVATETGISTHTVSNMVYAKVCDLKLEFVFKIAVVTGHSVCEYIALMLKEEDIDFADRIYVLREKDMVLVPYTDTITAEDKQRTPLSDDAKSIYDRMITQMEDQARTNSAAISQIAAGHKEQLQEVIAAAERSRGDAISAKNEIISHLTDTIRGLRRKIAMLTGMLVIETSVIITVLIADIVSPNVGWILSRILKMGSSSGLRG